MLKHVSLLHSFMVEYYASVGIDMFCLLILLLMDIWAAYTFLLLRIKLQLGAVAHAYNLSTIGGQGGQIT